MPHKVRRQVRRAGTKELRTALSNLLGWVEDHRTNWETVIHQEVGGYDEGRFSYLSLSGPARAVIDARIYRRNL